jgi:class 3 adenylate cyclase
MREVVDWLKKLGMTEYTERFVENGISVAALRYLTDQDLREMGVLLGHRRIMLAAISELTEPAIAAPMIKPETQSSAEDAATPTAATRSIATEAPGERRYLTVMFCDLVGSTSISAQLDAEEWRDLVNAYLDAASAAVAEMGGHVAKKLGDGLMAVFGYPVAHENDAERAARASLSIQRALVDLNRKTAAAGQPALNARIGIETGPVVIDAAGEIYGDPPNVAARVQAQAEPGAVVVTARVQRQIAGLFVAEERGSCELKGLPEPVTLFRLVRGSGGGRRSGQRHWTPLVGRDEEITILMSRWGRARQGEGQLMLIVGEPGLGKSRLIEEFHRRLRDTRHTWAEWSCSQLLQNTPLHPIADWGRQRFGAADMPAEQRLADLENTLALVKLDPVEHAPLLAPLFEIPAPKDCASTWAPEELRRRQLAALTNFVIAGARTQPAVLAFEDLHWADPTTLDLLRGLAERGALVPLFILLTARPEFRPPWGMRSHHSTISLAPLDRVQVRHMVRELAASHVLSKELIDGVTERSGGVPLFVEEVTRLLLERGEQGGIEAIPPTLQQSLTARLDRLGPAREIAQIGAVIGRDFSYALLRAVAEVEDAPLRIAVEKLAQADILLAHGLAPDSDYRFKHALIQDAAYENLLKSRRQILHRRVAEVLRNQFANRAAAEPQLLAHHFTRAGLTEAAIEWWSKAGDQALRRSAFQEAASHLGKTIVMADQGTDLLPPGGRLRLQIAYSNAVVGLRGQHAPETKAAFSRAHELAAVSQETLERVSISYGLWAGSFARCETTVLQELSTEMLKDVELSPDSPESCVAHRLYGATQWVLGNYLNARDHLEQAVALTNPERDHELAFRFGIDLGVIARVCLTLALWPLGEVDRARTVAEEAVALATRTDHAPTLAYLHFYLAWFEMLRGDPTRSKPHAEASKALARKYDMNLWQLLAPMAHGWAIATADGTEAGWNEVQRGIADCREQGMTFFTTSYEVQLGAMNARAGYFDAGLAMVDRALAEAEQTKARAYVADGHRIRGEILLTGHNAKLAEEAFLAAIALAQQQKARSFEMRSALALAKLYQSSGSAADAYAVLAPTLEGFTPTQELPEIEQAQQLLAVLKQQSKR